ncbi:MAG: type II secretion system minor pseudopilin GspK [Gammaproteobacteria bacterium]|nr:type II secretion system minor pseudopilin GspK [Gammaproteobacteria bacterium]
MRLSRAKISTTHQAKKQQGVAIITALLIVTIAATVSIAISTRLQLDIRRTGNLIAQDQALFYIMAAEEWSQRILRQDKKDSSIDSLDESWATELPPLPVDGGTIQGKLTDLQACININSLVDKNAVNATTKTRLSQLFAKLKISGDLTQAIADWIDTDMEASTPNGAEDDYYLNLESPYRTANTALQSISELRLIKGFEDSVIYNRVKPYLCAYPNTNGITAVNINTASAEVLQSLSTDMTEEIANNILEHRAEEAFKDIKEFTGFANIESLKKAENISTGSDYFLLRTQAIIGQANMVMYSIIYRDAEGKTTIVSRTQRTL